MLLKRLFFSSLLLYTFLGCKEDDKVDCSLVDCLSVDNSIYFKVIDKTTGENLISNGTYLASQINIQDLDSNIVDFELQKDFENQDLLVLHLQNNHFGDLGYQITIEDENPFNLTLTAFFIQGDECCGPYIGTDDISLTGIEGEFVNQGTLPITVTVFVP
ncbi:hypothetical protein [Allomuricauda sp. R78024]|uniref:hypothetical protein n=1 Tax=Allomuricauda sp. R78024 TaxID=3093867 RepID=UPI0037CA4387